MRQKQDQKMPQPRLYEYLKNNPNLGVAETFLKLLINRI
jgi:hypothetical protein